MWIQNSALSVFVVYFENVTTHVVRVDQSSFDSESASVRVTQIMDDQLKLRVPKGWCARGHQIDIKIEARTAEKEWAFRSRAKVSAQENLESEQEEIIIELFNDKSIDFQRFKDVFQIRQDEVEKLFKAVKGK